MSHARELAPRASASREAPPKRDVLQREADGALRPLVHLAAREVLNQQVLVLIGEVDRQPGVPARGGVGERKPGRARRGRHQHEREDGVEEPEGEGELRAGSAADRHRGPGPRQPEAPADAGVEAAQREEDDQRGGRDEEDRGRDGGAKR